MSIPLYKVFLPDNIDQVLKPVLLSGFITEGPQAKAFEIAFQEYIGNPHTALVNSGTAALTLALKMAGVGPGTNVISSPMTCFGYSSPVLLEDGSTLPIGKIVNQKIACSVASFNREKQVLEYKPVTNWVKHSSSGVEWYRLHTKNARASRGVAGKSAVLVTGDHKILTEKGYVRVDCLTPEDKIITNQQCLNSKQKEFVTGTLLGDASIAYNGKGWARFNVTHAVSQSEWSSLKERALAGHSLRRSVRPSIPGHQAAIRLETKKSPEWRELRLKWYPKGKKVVPKDIELTPLVLATWYMDDGSLAANSGVHLSTQCFDSPSFWVLFYKLVGLGFKPHAVRRGEGYVITLGNGVDGEGSASRFFKSISAYIPQTMRYKLPKGQLPAYDPRLWSLGKAGIATDCAVAVKVDATSFPTHYKTSHVYCLEVADNHNFVTAGMVVSNCLATNAPVVTLGGTVVWCDVDPATGNIDPEKIEELITPQTKAILFVDWAGTPAELDRINAVAVKHGIKTIEDAAHAISATYKGRPTGNSCDFSCFSFQAIKHMTTIDGGALACKAKEDYERAILLRWFGLRRGHNGSPVCWEGDVLEAGFKMHMNDVNAAIGLEQLKYVDANVATHRSNGRYLTSALAGLPNVETCKVPTYIESSHWFYTIKLENETHRSAVNKGLTEHGIGSNISHTRNDAYSVFGKCDRVLPGLDDFGSRMLNIPCGWWVGMDDLEYIVSVLAKVS